MSRNLLTGLTLAAAIGLTPLMAAPAQAAGGVQPSYVDLSLSVQSSTADGQLLPAEYGDLSCREGDDHNAPLEACAELAAVNGDAGDLNVNPDRACPLYYAPVTVTLKGWWGSEYKSFTKTYGNSCELANTTGPVFSI
ncbi:SSI family serine proteinase inhibitor [Streptomyces sp. NPDC003023]|uniref:SSI family serine proteinase inhibitor n=1 Tax=Streptomyces sp. NPDC003023 TaxID=3364675 RepID=UPI0036A398EE